MSLESILAIAASGIAATSDAIAVTSNNVANAGTVGYVRERSVQSEATSDGVGSGVFVLPAQRDLDAQLQAADLAQAAVVSGGQTTTTALSSIDSVQGTTGSGDDLASLLGKLQDSFTTLAGDPGNQTQQSAVVDAAQSVTDQIQKLAGAVGTARQSAQDDAVSAVTALNQDLAQVGTLSHQIVVARASGQGTADLENQRDQVIAAIGQIIPVRALSQASGDITLIGAGSLVLPTTGTASNGFALSPARLGTGINPAASAPALTLGGQDVTASVQGGRLGADLTLRDRTLPGYQAGLDEFSHTLATRFDVQGLTLFTDASGNLPTGGGTPAQSGYLGFSSSITVNPVARAQPSVVRDGLQGAAPTTPSGAAGDATLIDKVLRYAFGAQQSAAVAQPPPATTGLGPSGTLTLPYAAPSTIGQFATALSAALASDTNAAKSRLDTDQALKTTYNSQLGRASGVSIDTEMSKLVQLQNAYAANGKVISAVQSMWTSLLGMLP